MQCKSAGTCVSVVLIAALCAPQFSALAAGGPPHPDIVGIAVGKSTSKDTEAAITALDSSLPISTQEASFRNVPGSRFVTVINARGDRSGPSSFRHTITVYFSAPPENPVAIFVARSVVFKEDERVTEETFMGSLASKYGANGHKRQVSQKSFLLTWAWDKDGASLALNDRHPCAQAGLRWPTNGDLSRQENQIKAGCAAIVQVGFGPDNGIVGAMDARAADLLTGVTNARRTTEYLSGASESSRAKELEAAKSRKGPKL